MEKELIINGIKYVREDNTENDTENNAENNEKYNIVQFCGFDWYVIEEDEKTQTLFMKDKLSPKQMEKYFDEDVLDSDRDTRFSFVNNKWRDSHIRFVLNSKFLNDLNIENLVIMESSQKINNEEIKTNDYVRLLTIEDARNLPKEILKTNYDSGYWLGSASDYRGYYDYVWSVYSVGWLDYFSCYYMGAGVRPVVKISKSNI